MSMLHGRESLIRLVGKRKRILSPNHLLLLSPPKIKDDEIQAEELLGEPAASEFAGDRQGNDHAATISEPEFVPCPVCAASIRAADHIVNAHLDICLSRGTKRKLTQRTLLQLNFCPISESNSCLSVPDTCRKDVSTNDLLGENKCSESHMPIKFGPLSERNSCLGVSDTCREDLGTCDLIGENKICSNLNTELNSCSLKNNGQSLSATNAEGQVEANVTNDTVGFDLKMLEPKSSSSALSQSMELMNRNNNCPGVETGDAKFVGELESFIVGRKFHDQVVLQQGASLSIWRDHQNPKDKNAIKVLSTDSECGEMLGYLPREVAKFLAPLIDDHHLRCEGSIMSLPQHPLDAVPIHIICQKTEVSIAAEYDSLQKFEFLWENIQRVTEDAKINPPSMAKYQQNFRIMVEDVLSNHAHLFTGDEKLFLGSFNLLGNDAQRLFIRIYTRKGPWFRLSNISYAEIAELQQAIKELQLASYICSFTSSEDIFKYNMKELLEVLTVLEMREIANFQLSKKAINSARRQDLVDSLSAEYETGSCPLLPKLVLERVGTCIKISSAADVSLWRVQRLFFLNGEQDLSAFLLSDLGLIKFPDYTCCVTHPIFQCRDDLLEYEKAVEVAQTMDECLDENNVEMVIRCIDVSDNRMLSFREATQSSGCDSPPAFFSCFSASWVYSKVLSLGVSVFEHERRYEDAIRLLKGLLRRITCDSRRGYWTLRLSVNLEHLGRVNESLCVAEEGVLDPWVRAGSKMALQKRVLRLGKPPRRWKIPSYSNSVKRKIKEVSIRGRPLNSDVGSKNIFYGYNDELCGVEQLSLQYYAEEGGGWQGVHSESGIWMTIFGVLMWDVIFADVPNVFRSRFQTAPLDLRTDDFYATRKDLIECHLQKIQEGMAEEMLITSWELHSGTACQGVNWDRHSLSELRAVVTCIRGHCLASLCRHLALDYRSWSSGMSDLLLWRFHEGCAVEGCAVGGEAKLVEVKGPKDRLSEQQRAWMLILMDCGFDVEVCKVSPTVQS